MNKILDEQPEISSNFLCSGYLSLHCVNEGSFRLERVDRLPVNPLKKIVKGNAKDENL